MGGLTRTLALLLLLVMTGGRLVATACEFACLKAASVSLSAQPESAATTAGHECHESAFAPHAESPGVITASPHAGCRHGGTSAPFFVTAKFASWMTSDGSTVLTATFAEPTVSGMTTPRLQEQTPPSVPLLPIATLRI